MTWRNCAASMTLRAAINQKWPHRDTASDGTIGDAAHATRVSDHNPWIVLVEHGTRIGIVRARDIDKDGIPAAWLAEQLRRLGAAGDPRLTHGGYVIFNRRITSPDFTHWTEYTGTNPHTGHIHVSFSLNHAGYDSPRGWWNDLFGPTKPAPTPARPTKPAPATGARPTIERGSTLPRYVKDVQRRLKTVYPAYAKGLVVDGIFGRATEVAVREFQRRSALAVDGIVGQRTWKALGY